MFPDPATRLLAVQTCLDPGATTVASEEEPVQRRECYYEFLLTGVAVTAQQTVAVLAGLDQKSAISGNKNIKK